MDLTTGIFVVVIIIFSAIVHEVMHGYVADKLGDPTARYAGRLTLNPIPHIDPIGTIFLPLLLILSHSPIFFGYAKPVPYNPYNLRPGRFSEAAVSFAGPFSNLCIALIGGLAIRFTPLALSLKQQLLISAVSGQGFAAATNSIESLFVIFVLLLVVNVMLFAFNLIPIPPLDGARVLESLLPGQLGVAYGRFIRQMQSNPMIGILIVVIIIYVLGGIWGNFIYSLAQLIAGV